MVGLSFPSEDGAEGAGLVCVSRQRILVPDGNTHDPGMLSRFLTALSLLAACAGGILRKDPSPAAAIACCSSATASRPPMIFPERWPARRLGE